METERVIHIIVSKETKRIVIEKRDGTKSEITFTEESFKSDTGKVTLERNY